MESRLAKLGGSLKVPNVQELAKQNLASVPTRYVRRDLNPSQSHQCSSPPQIPVIDMHNFFDPDSMDSELLKLHKACKEWGFFQIINHGAKAGVIEKMKSEIENFFHLPVDERNKFRQEADDIQGYGQAFVVSEEQKLDWADMFYIVTLPTCLRKPHLIPNLPAPFRDAIDAYGAEVKELAMKILKLMAKALGMKGEEMESLFEQGTQSMRMNYYPPCPQPELVSGLSPHSDGIGLTILLQLNQIDGLQVKNNGLWIPVSSLPDAFTVNIGDMLEVVTNGEYGTVEHSASVNAMKERLSIATFLSPNLDGDLGPAPSLVTPQTPSKFKTITVADYFRGYFSTELKGKSFLDTIRINQYSR